MGRPAFSPVALSRESCTSIFQPADCWQPLQIMLAQMRRSFLARRLPNKTYALFNGPWNIFQPDGAIPLQNRIPRHHGITPRTQIGSAMCGAPRLNSRGPSGIFGKTRRAYSAEVAQLRRLEACPPSLRLRRTPTPYFPHSPTSSIHTHDLLLTRELLGDPPSSVAGGIFQFF